MNDKPAISKHATWALMALLALAVLAFAFFKARPKWERAESAECRVRLKTIGSLLQAWKGANNGRFPADLDSLRALAPAAAPKSWMCPSDKEQSSYDYLFPVSDNYDKTAVFVRCRNHGHACLADGSVSAAAGSKYQ